MQLVVPPQWTGRLRLSVSPDPAGRAALDIYRPLTLRGTALRTLTALSARRRTARTVDDPVVDTLADRLGLEVSGACVMASSAAGRRVVGLAVDRRLRVVAKIGDLDDRGLRNEAELLAGLRSGGRLRIPELLFADELDGTYALVTGAVAGPPRRDGAAALEAALGLAEHDVTHGDLAPWNLIGRPATVVDWESGRGGHAVFWDLCHFAFQSESLLGAGRASTVLAQLCGPGGIGAEYLSRLDRRPADAPALLTAYLDDVDRRAGATRTQLRLAAEIRSMIG